MQVDEPTHQLYVKKAPELLDSIEAAEEAPWIMRKDPASGFCIKLDNGLCGIHAKFGEKFLGDACYFYPRVTRLLGDLPVMTATMSCPEIARIELFSEKPCGLHEFDADRLPHTMKNYLPDHVELKDALTIHEAFLAASNDDNASAELIFWRIASASRSLERIDPKNWVAMAAFYIKNADVRIPAPHINPVDPFNILHALCGLIVASGKPASPRLKLTIEEMETALEAELDWQNVQINATEKSLDAYTHAKSLWDERTGAVYAPVLRRWLQMQMSLALYPYGGLGTTISERITIIGVRLATVKLALLSNHSINKQPIPQDVVVRIVQSLSRFLDHLGDPAFSLSIYTETGWNKEERMRGLLQ